MVRYLSKVLIQNRRYYIKDNGGINMETKVMSMAEIRESLARDDAENVYEYRDMFEIFLNGCPGYNSYENNDCIDYYIQRHYPIFYLDDEDPVEVLQVVDDGNGAIIAKIIQHQSDVDVEFI